MANLRSKFNQLKFDLSKKYDGDDYKKLKFCLFDDLELATLTEEDSIGHTLFNALDTIGGNGHISPFDVSLLLEITTLTGPSDAKALVEQYIEDNLDVDDNIHNTEKNKLSPYRRQVFMAVIKAKRNALQNVVNNYGLKKYGYTSLWDAVLALECEQHLADNPDKIKEFGQYLGKHSQDELQKIPSMGKVPELNEDPHPTEKSKRKLKQRKHEQKDEQKVGDKSEETKLPQAQENKEISLFFIALLVGPFFELLIASELGYLHVQMSHYGTWNVGLPVIFTVMIMLLYTLFNYYDAVSKFVRSVSTIQKVACVFFDILFGFLIFQFVDLSTVNIVVCVFIIILLAVVVLYGDDALRYVPFINVVFGFFMRLF